MRSVDERCAAVRRRARRLRRRRDDWALAILVCLMAIPLVDLAWRTASDVAAQSPEVEGGLFAAASLFGSSAGGYVLVALATAVAVVLITVLCIRHRRQDNEEEDAAEAVLDHTDDTGIQDR